MESTTMGVCEEQRRLEEEEDLLLGTGSGESAADESELLRMDIDIEDDIGNSTKPSGVGTETLVNSNGSGTNSGNSTKPSGVDNSKGSGSNSIPEGVSTGESNTRVSANTISVGTESSSNAQTSSVVGNPEVCQDGTYLAINLFKRQSGTAPNLLGGVQCRSSATGSLFTGNNGWLKHCHTSWDFANKMNVMTSFNTKSLECGCCNEHTKILEKRVESRPVYRRTFVLTDQNFIATAPAALEGKQCLKIIRIENASLWDLHNYIRDLIWDRDLAMPVGSAILIGSASHLGNVGPSVYAEELVQINLCLQQMFDGTIYFIPCPPMLVAGSSDPTLVRAILETSAWLKNIMHGDTCYLADSFRVVTELLLKRGTSGAIASNIRMMMPVSLSSGNRARWDSGCTNLPLGVLPLSLADEENILSTLFSELNQNLTMELDPSPNLSPTTTKTRTGPLLLVVGTSHAGRTADALEKEGATVLRATIPGWRAIKLKVPAMVDLIRGQLAEVRGDCIVIIQLFDNSFYLAKTEEGGLIPPVKESAPGSKYHVHGELVFAPKELQYSIFNTVKPILEAVSSHQKIMISPLPRYLKDRCCEDVEHVSNLEEEDYSVNLEEAIMACRRNLKDFAFRNNIKNIRVICPWTQLKKMEDVLWEAGPVHMSATGYSVLAGLVLSTVKQNEGLNLVPTRRSVANCGDGGSGGGGRGGGSGSADRVRGTDRRGGGHASATPMGGTWRPRPQGTRGYGWRGGRHHY